MTNEATAVMGWVLHCPGPTAQQVHGAEELPEGTLISGRDTGKGQHCQVPHPHRVRGVQGPFAPPGLGAE